MEARIAKLEEFATDVKERLARIEARQSELAQHQMQLTDKVGALQVEMHKGFADMIKWVVGTAIVLGGTAITVITFVLNNATPKPAPTPTTPPSVVVYAQPVQVPVPAAATARPAPAHPAQ
jgi:hypothetical protein